jgi:hypothetical protein
MLSLDSLASAFLHPFKNGLKKSITVYSLMNASGMQKRLYDEYFFN